MRIIAGEKRGTKLTSPIGENTRPTTDRVRESLFGSIQFEVTGAQILDLFAGSGALGLEALSRGAKEAVFCDVDAGSIKVIEKNIETLGYAAKSKVIKNDFLNAIALFKNTRKFDIVFIDPPYKRGYYEAVFEALASGEVLAGDALLVAESAQGLEIEGKGFVFDKRKKYGKTFLDFFRWQNGL
ncbi:MAG: 16S rRNA (guanine(966)-N(2))-methyltransferase RsmD [Christensenella sp.]|nr:16S rRNA (guanine(966)-N(2))-methyltransferase RsmD [Christensenella sp.]